MVFDWASIKETLGVMLVVVIFVVEFTAPPLDDVTSEYLLTASVFQTCILHHLPTLSYYPLP